MSTLNFGAGEVVSGLAVSRLGAGGLCLVSSARAHLVVDLVGAWAPLPPGGLDAGVVDGADAGEAAPVSPSALDSGPGDTPRAPEPGLRDAEAPVQGAGCTAAPGLPLLALGLAVLRRRGRGRSSSVLAAREPALPHTHTADRQEGCRRSGR